MKGDNMAVSKHSRASDSGPNPFFLELFRDLSDSGERERSWHIAMAHGGEGTPPLRFPVYEHLYLLNVYAQKMAELLEDVSRKFAINSESLPYYQSLIQYVRASASHGLIDLMAGVEQTEAWLHQSQQRVEEEKLRDPDDVYISVREREAERLRQRLPPRIEFLDESPPVKAPAAKKRKAGKAS